MADELQGKLPDGFPNKAALEAAGITTYAQLRKAGDVTSIEGIGPASKEKIDAAIAGGAQKTGTDDDKLTTLETTEVSGSEMASMKGTAKSGKASLAASPATMDALAEETAGEKTEQDNSVYGRLSRSGYVLNENQITGERWIGETIQNDPDADHASKLKTRITPIAEVRPWRGLEVRPKNGEPFAVSEEYDKDTTPASWLGMLIPGTNRNFIEA